MGQQDNTQGNTSQGNMNQGNMQGNGNPWGPTGNPAGIFVRSIPLSIVLTIITCGIYGLYWYYKMGEKVDYLNNIRGGNAGVLYLILGIFGLGIVNMCLIQDTINKKVRLG